MALRAQWIVDPTDHSGRRLIAVWSREPVPANTPQLPIKRAVLADERADEEWPQAS